MGSAHRRLPPSLTPADLAALLPALRAAGVRDAALAGGLEARVAALTASGALAPRQTADWALALRMLKPQAAAAPAAGP